MFNILLVEDDEKIREILCYYYKVKGENEFLITEACSGEECFEKLYEKTFDLILLDIMLPGMDGFKVCEEIRKNNDVPIIFITARSMEEDVLKGYRYGCDDYIIKPFMMSELYAKVRAIINRSKGMVVKQSMQVGNIVFDSFNGVVKINEKEIKLPHIEYEILKKLMENKNHTVLRETLLTAVWGYDFEGNERALDDHIRKLRRALGTESYLVKTVVHFGYKICDKGD